MPEFIEVTDAAGGVLHPDWLARAEPVHRQLRAFPDGHAAVLARVFAGGGRLRLAVEGDRVLGLALYRVHENTYAGLQLFVDDLVTDEGARSRGIGRALLSSLEGTARERGCATLALDSGTQRTRAHAFYAREGMAVTSHHFVKSLGSQDPP